MECRVVRYGEKDRVRELHRELVAFDPSLGEPKFHGNPVPSDPHFPFLFYCIEDGQILGSRRAMPDIVRRGSRSYPFAWGFDSFVQPAARGKGIGSKLVAAQVAEFDKREEFCAAAFSAAAMMRIYRKMGFNVLGFVPRHALVRESAPFLSSKLGSAALARIASIPLDLALSARLRMRKGRNLDDLTVSAIEPTQLRELWEELPEPGDVYRWDDPAEWATSRLQQADICCAVRSSDSDRLIALFILRDRQLQPDEAHPVASRMTMVHYKYDGSDKGAWALARALASRLYEDRKSVADIVTSDPLLQSHLERAGFSRREEGMTFVFRAPPGMTLPDAERQSDWKLTHFCSDGFLFP
jgi:GNAT superfamily N-acetyltransferase